MNQRSNRQRAVALLAGLRGPRKVSVVLGLLLSAAWCWQAPTASAQDVACDGVEDFPCSFQGEAVALQKVPAIFKFQSRVSQAKLPLGEAVFETVFVKVLRGTETICQEQFSGVTVQDSVMNLEIGRNMSCELDEVIAENASLSFQVCLGGQENCLRPLDLAASPYAIKSSFASQAQSAHQADISGQAHYAHRITADRDLLLRNTLGTGYFDFYTHPAEAVDALYNAEDYLEYANSGFIQWTPLSAEGAFSIHIVAKDPQTDELRMLDRFVVAASQSILRGSLTVTEGGAHVVGDSEIEGDTTITGLLLMGHDPNNLLGLIDRSTHGIDGALQVTGATMINSGGVHVIGDSDVQGSLGVNQVAPAFSLDVSGDINFTGQLRRNGEILAVSGAQWEGNEGGDLYYTSGDIGVGTANPAFLLDVAGDINFSGQLRRNGEPIPLSPWVEEQNQVSYAGEVSAERFVSGSGSLFEDLQIGAEGTGFGRGAENLRNQGERTGLRVFTGGGQVAAVFSDAGELVTQGGGNFSAVTASGAGSFGSVSAGSANFTSLNASGAGSFGSVSAGTATVTTLTVNNNLNVSNGGLFGDLAARGALAWNQNGTNRLGRMTGYLDDEAAVPIWGSLRGGARMEVFGVSKSHWFNRTGDAVFEGNVYGTALFHRDGVIQNSDARIKDIVGVSDAEADLQKVMSIEVTDYTMKDQRQRGARPYKMLIAQQLERVFPQAVTQARGVVPDVLAPSQRAQVRGDEIEVTLAQVHGLSVGDRVMIEVDGGAQTLEVVQVPGPAAFVARGWRGEPAAAVFVYGREVDDFRSVNYDEVSMLNLSATQALARRVEALREELTELRAENDALRRRFAELDELREDLATVRAACNLSDL